MKLDSTRAFQASKTQEDPSKDLETLGLKRSQVDKELPNDLIGCPTDRRGGYLPATDDWRGAMGSSASLSFSKCLFVAFI